MLQVEGNARVQRQHQRRAVPRPQARQALFGADDVQDLAKRPLGRRAPASAVVGHERGGLFAGDDVADGRGEEAGCGAGCGADRELFPDGEAARVAVGAPVAEPGVEEEEEETILWWM